MSERIFKDNPIDNGVSINEATVNAGTLKDNTPSGEVSDDYIDMSLADNVEMLKRECIKLQQQISETKDLIKKNELQTSLKQIETVLSDFEGRIKKTT